MNNPDLAQLQYWFQEILTSPGQLSEKVSHADNRHQLEIRNLIRSDEQFSLSERLNVYVTGYMLRLLECMQADLPSLYAFLGPKLFDLFGKAYLLEQPSSSYSLFYLTDGFADFLDRTKPSNPDPELKIRYDIPGELVRLERARVAAILSQGTEGQAGLSSFDFFSLFTGSKERFRAHPALQLLKTRMPLISLYRQLMQEEEPVIPIYSDSYLAVTRVHFAIQFYELSSWQYHFLKHLQYHPEEGLQEAVHFSAETCQLDKSAVLSELMLWIPNALSMGLLFEI